MSLPTELFPASEKVRQGWFRLGWNRLRLHGGVARPSAPFRVRLFAVGFAVSKLVLIATGIGVWKVAGLGAPTPMQWLALGLFIGIGIFAAVGSYRGNHDNPEFNAGVAVLAHLLWPLSLVVILINLAFEPASDEDERKH